MLIATQDFAHCPSPLWNRYENRFSRIRAANLKSVFSEEESDYHTEIIMINMVVIMPTYLNSLNQGRRRNEHVVFTTNSSPSESLMNHSVGFFLQNIQHIFRVRRKTCKPWEMVLLVLIFLITPGTRENPQHLLRGQDDYQVTSCTTQLTFCL